MTKYNPPIKQFFVPEAKARILGPSDLHVKAGSSITLTCIIKQGPHDLGTVFWYRGSDILDVSPHPNDASAASGDTTGRITIQVCYIATVTFQFVALQWLIRCRHLHHFIIKWRVALLSIWNFYVKSFYFTNIKSIQNFAKMLISI